jgi:hypothetical protein
MYTLTATAAGVGILALAQPVQAKIIYTPAHKNFSQYPPLALDLNHDGIGDFVLDLGGKATSGSYAWRVAFAYAPRSNNMDEVVVTEKGHAAPAVALRAGSRIGPGRQFGGPGVLVGHFSRFMKGGGTSTSWQDQWGNGGKGLKGRYLGLKFYIDGKVHYGWARVTVTAKGKNFTATLTGYAYETIPNKPILAGKTKGREGDSGVERLSTAFPTAAVPTSAMLGVLALGAQSVPLWRQKDLAAVRR